MKEAFDCVVGSPPFADSLGSNDKAFRAEGLAKGAGKWAQNRSPESVERLTADYGSSPGQLGAMKEGTMETGTEAAPGPVSQWAGCYDENHRGLIVEAAFAHPAKCARGLIKRIFSHMEQRGWLPPRSRVLDVFGGIGVTLIEGASRGHECIGIELEARFWRLWTGWECDGKAESECGVKEQHEPHHVQGNLDLHRHTWTTMGDPLPVMLHGDSRKAGELVRGHFASVVSSPPYAESNVGNDDAANELRRIQEKAAAGKTMGREHQRIARKGKLSPHENAASAGYGNTNGNLGAMREGDVEACIGSPPYANEDLGGGEGQRKMSGQKSAEENKATKEGKGLHGNYGQTEGQLGRLKEGSLDAVLGKQQEAAAPGSQDCSLPPAAADFGVDAVVEACVGSPPWEDQRAAQGEYDKKYDRFSGRLTSGGNLGRSADGQYGASEGQIGNTQGETFWAAARTILEQVYGLLKPGGMSAWIVKAYCKSGKIVDFPGNWLRLCQSVGFEHVETVHASLVKTETHQGLFGAETKTTKKCSFFRRLAEKKGSPPIDHETVLFVRKP